MAIHKRKLMSNIHQLFLEQLSQSQQAYLSLQARSYQQCTQFFLTARLNQQEKLIGKDAVPREGAACTSMVKACPDMLKAGAGGSSTHQLVGQRFCDKWVLDPEKEPWVQDHCPTYTRPALPLMSISEIMATHSQTYFPQKVLIAIQEMKVIQWAVIDKPTDVFIDIHIMNEESANVRIFLNEITDKTQIAQGKLIYSDAYQEAPPPPAAAITNPLHVYPYGYLFHGPAFHVAESLVFAREGSSAQLSADTHGFVPLGTLNQRLLDGATHGVYHEEGLAFWHQDLPENHVCFPTLIRTFRLFRPTPCQGMVRCETRFIGFYHSRLYPIFRMSLVYDDKLWCEFEILYAVLPMLFLGMGLKKNKGSFLSFLRGEYTPEVHLSEFTFDETNKQLVKASINLKTVQETHQAQWFPHLLEDVYDINLNFNLATLSKHMLIKEFFANKLKCHPSEVIIRDQQTVSQKDTVSREGVASRRHDAKKIYNYHFQQQNERLTVESQ